MESRKRTLSTNNNSYSAKKIRLSASIDPQDLSDLGVDILSDEDDGEDSDSETASVYNDHAHRVAVDFEETQKLQPLPKGDLIYKRKSSEELKIDFFSDLPDEIVMKILGNLDKKSLVALALTCHRFDRLCHDEALWPRLNLAARKLEVDNIGHILGTGVKVLRLYATIFPTPILSPQLSLKMENFVAKVKYLDLSYIWISVEDLVLLLNKTRYLTKLSLENVAVNVDVMKAVVNNNELDTLNLAMATGLDHACISVLVKNLTKLESLNLAWTRLPACAYPTLCNELTPAIKHLDLSGTQGLMKNSDLVSLIKRCCLLESLDISDCLAVTLVTIREIVKNLHNLKVLAITRCYTLHPPHVMELTGAANLEVLSAYRMIADADLENVRAAFPAVRVNRDPLSAIARPTVGIRRTSIWEQPTSD